MQFFIPFFDLRQKIIKDTKFFILSFFLERRWEGKLKNIYIINICYTVGDRNSSVGIATDYGPDGLGIEFRWGLSSLASVQTGPGAYPASYTKCTRSLTGVKRPGNGVDHLPLSSTEVEGRVELYICSPSGPSWPVLRKTLPFTFICYTVNNFKVRDTVSRLPFRLLLSCSTFQAAKNIIIV